MSRRRCFSDWSMTARPAGARSSVRSRGPHRFGEDVHPALEGADSDARPSCAPGTHRPPGNHIPNATALVMRPAYEPLRRPLGCLARRCPGHMPGAAGPRAESRSGPRRARSDRPRSGIGPPFSWRTPSHWTPPAPQCLTPEHGRRAQIHVKLEAPVLTTSDPKLVSTPPQSESSTVRPRPRPRESAPAWRVYSRRSAAAQGGSRPLTATAEQREQCVPPPDQAETGARLLPRAMTRARRPAPRTPGTSPAAVWPRAPARASLPLRRTRSPAKGQQDGRGRCPPRTARSKTSTGPEVGPVVRGDDRLRPRR